jgi:uncharacterized protein
LLFILRSPDPVVMTPNKKVVESFLDALGRMDRSALLSCLAEDVERVEWANGFPQSGVPVRGRNAVIQNLDRPADVTLRTEMARMTEENNVVVAEGTVRVTKKESTPMTIKFLDVFEFESGKVKRLDSFTATVNSA